ncbi:MAG: hypothetical protein ACLP7J_10250, partial [Streptosporangiaceae bacterium]
AGLDVRAFAFSSTRRPFLARQQAADRYLLSRSGFTKRLSAHAAADPLLTLITPAGIYSRAGR